MADNLPSQKGMNSPWDLVTMPPGSYGGPETPMTAAEEIQAHLEQETAASKRLKPGQSAIDDPNWPRAASGSFAQMLKDYLTGEHRPPMNREDVNKAFETIHKHHGGKLGVAVDALTTFFKSKEKTNSGSKPYYRYPRP